MQLNNESKNQGLSTPKKYIDSIMKKKPPEAPPIFTSTHHYQLSSYEYNHDQSEFMLELEDPSGYTLHITANEVLQNKSILTGLSKTDIITICHIAGYESSRL